MGHLSHTEFMSGETFYRSFSRFGRGWLSFNQCRCVGVEHQVNRVKLFFYFSNNMILEGEIVDAKMSSFFLREKIMIWEVQFLRWPYTCTVPQMIPNRKWSRDRKWSPKWTANDPRPQVIPKVDHKWSREKWSDYKKGLIIKKKPFSLAF